MIPEWLVEILRCPETGEELAPEQGSLVRRDGKSYPIVDDIPRLAFPEKLKGEDARWQRFYNWFAPIYDLNERIMGRLLAGVSVKAERAHIASLVGIEPGMRLLEVSPGPGVYHEYLRSHLGNNGMHVAADLSVGMLTRYRAKSHVAPPALVQANGSYLPFANDAFDVLFHFGGINLFSEPERALQEFVRVVRPRGIVAWGDEGFSPRLPNGWRKRLLRRMNPGYDRPRLPLPAGVENDVEHEVLAGYAYLVVARKMSPAVFEEHLKPIISI